MSTTLVILVYIYSNLFGGYVTTTKPMTNLIECKSREIRIEKRTSTVYTECIEIELPYIHDYSEFSKQFDRDLRDLEDTISGGNNESP